MNPPLTSITLHADPDVVMARQRARDVAALLGLDQQDQTRLATAVSEIARNAMMYAGGGLVEFFAEPANGQSACLLVRISDRGPGIRDLARILDGQYQSHTGMGLGIVGAQRLVDRFEIESEPGRGTTVRLFRFLPAGGATPSQLEALRRGLAARQPQNLVQELLAQNRELLRAMEDLRRRQEELARLNSELEDTNRGVVALYAELDERAEHLKRADEAKSRFLSHISHEFRTPLNSILALTGLLLRHADGPLTAEQEKQVGFVRRSAESLFELVNDLLDLAKVDAGKSVLRIGECRVGPLFGALRGVLRPMQVNESVNLVFEDAEHVPPLLTDESKLAQILRNLISNALKFTERGEVRVSAQWEPAIRTVTFMVSDTGIGIAPEHLESIFEEFTQIENPLQQRTRGTGLGLSLSRKLAELLGGSIQVQSELGKGSRFRLLLPCVLPQAAPHAARVLVIDDEEVSRYLLRQCLTASGFQALEAADGREGLERAAAERPAAVLLDLRMPGMSGFEVLGKLKAETRTRDIPVVVITSKRLDEHEREILTQSAAAICSKEFLQHTDAAAELRLILLDAGVAAATPLEHGATT